MKFYLNLLLVVYLFKESHSNPLPSNETTENKIKISTGDNHEMQVDKALIQRSTLIKNMVEDIGTNEEAIPLPNVKKVEMELILEWIEHHQNDVWHANPEDEEKEVADNELRPFDKEFFDELAEESMDSVFAVVMAANYLDIPKLLNVSCKYIAGLIKGKTAQEIRDLFGIENDFTQAEEDEIRKENEWALSE